MALRFDSKISNEGVTACLRFLVISAQPRIHSMSLRLGSYLSQHEANECPSSQGTDQAFANIVFVPKASPTHAPH